MNKALAKAHALAKRFRAEALSKRRHGFSPAARTPLFRAAAKQDRGELYVYQQIGAGWFADGVTAESVRKALDEMKGVKALDIFINSEGGDVFEAKAILAQLQRFSAEKTVYIDGLAASAATLIAMAGGTVVSSPIATWMVHNPWTIAVGEASDMRKTADVLDLEAQAIAETYAAKTGGTVEEMRALMDAETWMSAQDALDKGFTDSIADPDEDDDSESDDDEDGDGKKNAATPLIAAAARTQQLIRSTSPAQLMNARAEMRRRNHPGQPGQSRESASR